MWLAYGGEKNKRTGRLWTRVGASVGDVLLSLAAHAVDAAETKNLSSIAAIAAVQTKDAHSNPKRHRSARFMDERSQVPYPHRP